MNPLIVVGNDVVDLSNPRVHGKASDPRFVARIISRSERPGLVVATDPDLELWCLWAAKEAAYKVTSKVLGTPPVFAHADFRVAWSLRARAEGAGESTVRRGIVSHQGTTVPVDVVHRPGTLHAVACSEHEAIRPEGITVGVGHLDQEGAPWQGTMESLKQRLSEREAEAVHSHTSAAVRLGARAALARAMSVEEERLEIVCEPGLTGRRPPRVFLDGAAARADVSLSHDGSWIAWALWARSGVAR